MSRYIQIPVDTYVDVDICEFIYEIPNEYLLKEIESREISYRPKNTIKRAEDFKKGEFKRFLCDMLSIGYNSSADEIMDKINQYL